MWVRGRTQPCLSVLARTQRYFLSELYHAVYLFSNVFITIGTKQLVIAALAAKDNQIQRLGFRG